MRMLDAIVTSILRRLPERSARRGLARYFARRFAGAHPSMVSEVLFVNYATYLGLPRDALNTKFGERWGTVTRFDGDPYWLEYAETRSPVLRHLEQMVAQDEPFDCLIIDRSRIRGLGSNEPTHPAYHASFSLWRRMWPDEIAKLAASETFRAHVNIAKNAYVYDDDRL